MTLSAQACPSVEYPLETSTLETSKLLIERHGPQPHPEGGWYREVHRRTHKVCRADGAPLELLCGARL
jgi:hypothetical protein